MHDFIISVYGKEHKIRAEKLENTGGVLTLRIAKGAIAQFKEWDHWTRIEKNLVQVSPQTVEESSNAPAAQE